MSNEHQELTVPELKNLLRERGLNLGGKKADLIARLEEADVDAPAAEVEAVEEIEEADVDAPATEEETVEEIEEADVDAPVAVEEFHSDGFIAFVRHADQLLLLKRAASVPDFPGCWDGVYGLGDINDIGHVATCVEDATGIPISALTHVRTGADRGIEFGNRLNDITPVLFESETAEITVGSIYAEALWVDPGFINKFSPEEMPGSDEVSGMQNRPVVSQLGEMYGDVGSFLYMLKTTIGQEQKIAQEIRARLSGTGSLQDIQNEIFSVLHPHTMRGYVFVEASAKHHVEKVIGRAGGVTTPMRGCSKVLDGEASLVVVTNYLEPKSATAGIEVGCIVEIRSGQFRGNRARVTVVSEGKEEVTVELFEAVVPIPITMRADIVRVVERVDD